MKFLQITVATISSFSFLVEEVHGHGYMFEPISRNYYSNQFGLTWGTEPNIPMKEYCFHCLNTKGVGSVCGTSEQGVNYDSWLDSLQQPISWNSNGNVYQEGGIITVETFLTAHHTGHMELRACPMGRASTQECFDQHLLEFVEDVNNFDVKMPKDENYPERGYYYGSQAFNNNRFAMNFRLPQGLTGEEVLLQWLYVTANSCSPEGYAEYYSLNSHLPQEFWNRQLSTCTPEQFPPEFYTGDSPERFVNCAEISILPNDNNIHIDEPAPTPTPTPEISTQSPVQVISVPDVSPPTPIATPITNESESRVIAYVGNWQACPTDEQIAQYTHVVIAFAVSYQWSPGKNICSETCEIAMPPVCENVNRPDLIAKWKGMGKKVILSFGGAGMGGSWAGDNNDCWDYCFGRETKVIDRLTTIVNEMNLDGIDIDYEYFYSDNQNGSGFSKGAEARNFLTEVTVGLRNSMAPGAELTHAPMEPDMVPGTAYFEVMKDISHTLDFLMPQYYNGYVRSYVDFPGALSHFTTLANELFEGDASKIVYGFCINDCGSFNLDGFQSAEVMKWLAGEYPCNGGAFFWVANDDFNGNWSTEVNNQIASDADLCLDQSPVDPVPAPVPNPTLSPATFSTQNPTVSPSPKPTSLPTQSSTPYPTSAPVVNPTNQPIPSPPVSIGSAGCCSNDYKTCASWCNESRQKCGSPMCASMVWLENGSLSSDTCVSRWGACTNDVSSCCGGLVCKGESRWYKQCLAPNDPAPN